MINRFLNKIKKVFKKKLEKKIPVYIPTVQGDFLKGKTALITGGTSGIGYSIAEAFLRCGAENIIITGRSQKKCEELAEKLKCTYSKATGHVIGIAMDISDIESVKIKFQMVISQLNNTLDILVNNVGIYDETRFENMSEEKFDKVLNTNLKGTYFISQLVGKYMTENNIKGNILNLCSSSSYRPAIDPYMLSKWGIRGFTLGLAKTLIPYDIVVNGIAPGPTATPMLMPIDDIYLQHKTVPAKRYVAPEEIANLAVFLVSNMGRMIVGDIVCITGGAAVTTFDDVNY